ncbi:MAG: hypothetical protein HYY16_06205 [Planctomycetes bacterium]|nr:hypothetical protein [Planctomycetota bacterium]
MFRIRTWFKQEEDPLSGSSASSGVRFVSGFSAPLWVLLAATASLAEAAAQPQDEVVVIGNSMVGCGIDGPKLGELSGTRVRVVQKPGVMSSWNYVQVKRLGGIKLAIVVTREVFETIPHMRVGVRPGEDKVVDEVLAPWQGKYLSKWGEVVSDPEYAYLWDFHYMVGKSFLPHMIQAAKERGFTLVIARHKSRRYCSASTRETPLEKKYREDIAAYLTENGAVFLDYTLETQLKISHYANGDHLNQGEGRALWTRLMAEDIKAILAGKKAPHQLTGSAGLARRCPLSSLASAFHCETCGRIFESSTCATCKDGKVRSVTVCVQRYYRCEADDVSSLKGGRCEKCKKWMTQAVDKSLITYRCTGCGKEGDREGPCPEPECKKDRRRITKTCLKAGEFPHVSRSSESAGGRN